MMRNWIVAGTLLLVLVVSGCDNNKLMTLFAPAEEVKAGQGFVEDIRTGQFSPVLAAIDPAYQSALDANVLGQVRSLFDQKPVKSMKIVGSQSFKTAAYTRYGLTYEYEAGAHWILVQIILQTANGHQTIAGIHAEKLSQSLEQLNAFTFSNKNILALIFLGLVILVPVFIMGTAVVCWRTPIPKYKWLWRVFVLLGVAGFILNWTSGNLQFELIHVQLLGAGYVKPLFGPVSLQLSIPLGAILFWTRRKAWLAAASENTA